MHDALGVKIAHALERQPTLHQGVGVLRGGSWAFLGRDTSSIAPANLQTDSRQKGTVLHLQMKQRRLREGQARLKPRSG